MLGYLLIYGGADLVISTSFKGFKDLNILYENKIHFGKTFNFTFTEETVSCPIDTVY